MKENENFIFQGNENVIFPEDDETDYITVVIIILCYIIIILTFPISLIFCLKVSIE